MGCKPSKVIWHQVTKTREHPLNKALRASSLILLCLQSEARPEQMPLVAAMFLLLVSIALCLSWVVVKAAYSIWWKPRQFAEAFKRQGIHGYPYKLLFGNTKDAAAMQKQALAKPMSFSHDIAPRVLPFLKEAVDKYGKICLTWSGKTPQLILVEPEMVKEVLSNKSGNFPIPDVQGLLKVLGLGTGLPGLKGEEWANRRRIINPAFHMEKLKSLLPLFATSCSELVQRWEKSIGPQGSCELDVWVELQNLTADVISRAAFGSSYEEGKHIFQMQKKLEEMAAEILNALSIPVLRFVKTKKNRRREELKEKMTSLLSKIIEKREQEMKLGTAKNDDFLGILLLSNKNHGEYGSRGMTRDEIIEECKVFYSAGHESTSELLTWTMVLLSMNPSWQMHARDEVLKVCGRHAPSFDNLAQLKIMTMIIYEVLRLYPPAVMLGRETYSTVKLGDITLPAGVGLVVPVLLIHHDHTLWGDDANKFKPERFSEGVANATKNRLMFLPFSWGPRICIGQTFALNEAKMALAMILQNFTFELSPSYTHAPHTILTLQPQYGAQIILHKL